MNDQRNKLKIKKPKLTPQFNQTCVPMTFAAMFARPKFEGDETGGTFTLDSAHYHTVLFVKTDIARMSGTEHQSQIQLQDGQKLYFNCSIMALHKKMQSPALDTSDHLVDLRDVSLFEPYQDKKMTIKDVCELVQLNDPSIDLFAYCILFRNGQYSVENRDMFLKNDQMKKGSGYPYRIDKVTGNSITLPIKLDEFEALKTAAAIMQVSQVDYRKRIHFADQYLAKHKTIPEMGSTERCSRPPPPPAPPPARRL